MHQLLGIVIVGGAALLAGCSAPASSTHEPTRLSAVAVPSTSGPKICHRLAANLALRQLPAALSRLEVPSSQTAARQVVATASTELQGLAGKAPESLALSMRAAAGALNPLASSPPTQRFIDSATSALDSLAAASQAVCSFGSS